MLHASDNVRIAPVHAWQKKKKTAVRRSLCNSARGSTVRHNSPKSTRRNNYCREKKAKKKLPMRQEIQWEMIPSELVLGAERERVAERLHCIKACSVVRVACAVLT